MPHPKRYRVEASRTAEQMSRALAHIDARLDEPLNSDTLADRAAMSRHHFHRVFRAHVGCSVATYVTWRRLQRACALLASGKEPVLDIALSVGYESAQALAKAMRRELDTTPSDVRKGRSAPWKSLMLPQRLPFAETLDPPEPAPMKATRFTDLPDGIVALTATARGMVDYTMTRAAETAFGELAATLVQTGLLDRARSFLSLVPDDAHGPDDPHCRYVAGVVFGHELSSGRGACERPDVALQGSLAWQALNPGRYAVFTHVGPYTGLHRCWRDIYVDWLPDSGMQLRDAPPMELCLNDPKITPPHALRTELWVPVTEASGAPAER